MLLKSWVPILLVFEVGVELPLTDTFYKSGDIVCIDGILLKSVIVPIVIKFPIALLFNDWLIVDKLDGILTFGWVLLLFVTILELILSVDTWILFNALFIKSLALVDKFSTGFKVVFPTDKSKVTFAIYETIFAMSYIDILAILLIGEVVFPMFVVELNGSFVCCCKLRDCIQMLFNSLYPCLHSRQLFE